MVFRVGEPQCLLLLWFLGVVAFGWAESLGSAGFQTQSNRARGGKGRDNGSGGGMKGVVSALQRSRFKVLKDNAKKNWDNDLYDERRSVVEDEDLLTELLMQKVSLEEQHSLPQLVVSGKVVQGNEKPPIPQEIMELPIPLRPSWIPGVTDKAKLLELEQEEFMTWRKKLALIQDTYDVQVTPFEKSPFFWRQLWRVVERSQVVCQVLDARNPLLYRSLALERYISEAAHPGEPSETPKKISVLLLNKADLMPPAARKEWANYFKRERVLFAFFVSVESDIGSEEDAEAQDDLNQTVVSNQENTSLDAQLVLHAKDNGSFEEDGANETHIPAASSSWGPEWSTEEIFSPSDLRSALSSLAPKTATSGRTTVGFVGFPNVGKSSVLNALIGEESRRRVAHGPSPGKTKHFQTMNVEDSLCLCDCPGLVFPSVVASKEEMVCGGVLNIHTLREVLGPIQLICDKVPRKHLEDTYGISIPVVRQFVSMASRTSRIDPASDLIRMARMKRLGYGEAEEPRIKEIITASHFLDTLCSRRNFVKANSGLPDQHRAGKLVLRDWLNGALPHWELPPKTQF